MFQSKAFSSNLQIYLQGVEMSKLSSVCLHGDLEGTGFATSSWEQASSDSEVKQINSLLIAASFPKSSCCGEPGFSGRL